MIIADIIFIIILIIFALIGLIVGFGKGLKFFTKGFFGFIISIIICYCLGGLIIKISFVSGWLESFRGLFEGKSEWYFELLLTIRIDIIVYYIVLFIIVQILRAIIVSIIARVLETENVFLKFINKVFGMVLFVVMFAFFAMIAFQIVAIIGGETEASFIQMLSGSFFKLDWFYINNPLAEIITLLFRIEIRIPVEVTG